MVEAADQGRAGAEDGLRGRRSARGVWLVVLSLAAASLGPTRAAHAHHSPHCYVVGENSPTEHFLARVTKANFDSDTNEETVGVLGTLKTDGIALHPTTGVLYGVDTNMVAGHGVFGTIHLTTGDFTPIGSGLGTADGALGEQGLYDVSGLSFDPDSGALYATHVRIGASQPVDLLFQVNLATGTFVPDAFGAGVDYVPLPKLSGFPSFHDVDDIAFDPDSGLLYGIINNSTSGDRLMRINKLTGATTDVGAFGVAEVEGLDFDPHGQLWATAGGVENTEANKLYQVNKSTGAATSPRLLDNGLNYEALACMLSEEVVPLDERVYLPVVFR